jgi:hypothetical protein
MRTDDTDSKRLKYDELIDQSKLFRHVGFTAQIIALSVFIRVKPLPLSGRKR